MQIDKQQLEALLTGALEWCEAVQRGTSWDDWDSQYKAMCWHILPALGLKVRDQRELETTGNYSYVLNDEQRKRIAELVS